MIMASRRHPVTFDTNKTIAMNTVKLSLVAVLLGSNLAMNAQDSIPIVPSLRLNGPRLGITYIAPGRTAEFLDEMWSARPVLFQFGWQFETRFFTLPSGTAGLIEWALFLGGLEQGLCLPSANMLIGIRSARGSEFGFGPNLSISGAGLAFAVGHNFTSGGINFPVNIGFVPSNKGARVSLLVGFNARKR
jgi:hypothetical protein